MERKIYEVVVGTRLNPISTVVSVDKNVGVKEIIKKSLAVINKKQIEKWEQDEKMSKEREKEHKLKEKNTAKVGKSKYKRVVFPKPKEFTDKDVIKVAYLIDAVEV